MYFLLKNKVFESIINIIIIINILTIIIPSRKEIGRKNNKKKKTKCNSTFETITIIFWLIILIALFVTISIKFHLESLFSLLYYLFFTISILKIRKKNLNTLSYEDKSMYIQVTFLYIVFFSEKAINVYLNIFENINYIAKEYLLIAFLNIKIIFFLFSLIINLSIIVSNITCLFSNQIAVIKKKMIDFINNKHTIYFFVENYSPYKKANNTLPNYILYFFVFPFNLIYILIVFIIIFIIKIIFKLILFINNKIIFYLNNSYKIISRSIKISTIFSLLIVFIFIIYNSNIIDNDVKDVYSLIITVLLIPLIYDNIKANSEIKNQKDTKIKELVS